MKRNNDLLIKNVEKLCGDSSAGNTLNTPQIYFAHLSKSANYLNIFEKKLSSHVHCPCAITKVWQHHHDGRVAIGQ